MGSSLLGEILTTSLRQPSRPSRGLFGKLRNMILAVVEMCQGSKGVLSRS
ncbi:hypothetical protein OROGR_030785 [Orobanche gracilis]